ncbi:u3 small nucleolar RNA-associated protein 15 homolog [Trichonephila inaurata madagascariensis]|uniref:U3 small nucleolar RNA-associated protein 15 homolog n=1 Tax=Trichonephila inaurata madagascariensis TaxID=2747483 RepID=A0A8X6I3Z3_9ARAC|nr:u3 small nucleolar RNA-associated protein 15 homolog [Trichonephila inaurata madagascariensis]
MTEFKSLEIFESPRTVQTEDNIYWENLEFPTTFKEFGAIDFVDFSPVEPYNVAVTCGVKVQLYNTLTKEVLHKLKKFKDEAYGGVFRNDGNLLAAGAKDGWVRLYDVPGHRLLRTFKGHKAATHRCAFVPGFSHLLSFSDDKTVALWDVTTEQRLKSFEEHKDYIRAGAISQLSQDIFISGSYDHTVKMYDIRTGSSVMSVDHEFPVDSILIFPSGGLFISAGGTSIKVWDPIAGRMLAHVITHHKPITSLCFASNGRRLMSASLDRHVKIYDITSYEVVHTLTYPSPILTVAVAPDDKAVGVGMADGIFSLRQMTPKLPEESKQKKSLFHQYHSYARDFNETDNTVFVPGSMKKKERSYDRYLRTFQSSRALDAVLGGGSASPQVTITVMMELIRRGSIKAAMVEREGNSLIVLIRFVTKYIGDPKYMRVLIDVGLILLELYGPKFGDPGVRKLFQSLSEAVDNQILYLKEMEEIQAVIQTILVSTYSGEDTEELLMSSGTL